jgi:hypothetical protein
VTGIIEAWKREIESPDLADYQAVRELAVSCKKDLGPGSSIADFRICMRMRNYIRRLNVDEERVESFIAALSGTSDPVKFFEVVGHVAQISTSADVILTVFDSLS